MAAKTLTTKPIEVKVQKLHPDAIIPEQKSEGAACFDIVTIEDTYLRTLNASDRADVVRTGLAFEIPDGYHMKVVLRSSTGMNTKIRLANQIGIVDSDYRGELKLIVENPSRGVIKIPKGVRVAQCIIEKNIPVKFTEVDKLSETKRGTGGLGSTGEA